MNLICKQVILPSKMKNDLGCQFSERLTPREQLDGINNFALNNSFRVGVLYGLRRTGKTVLLKQWLQHLPYEEQKKAAYISIDTECMADVKHDLRVLRENGYKYIAIDEITECEDFIDRCAPLSNDFASSGMKIFITGTDSLSLLFAINNKLFDRATIFHTTYVSFYEWCRLTKQNTLDDYIHWGGLLYLQPTIGEIKYGASIHFDMNEIDKYFNSAISKNIQNSILRFEDGRNAGLLEPLLEDISMQESIYGLFCNITRNEFINIFDVLSGMNKQNIMASIQSVIEHDAHIFSANVMARSFKPLNLSRTARDFEYKDDNLRTIISNFTKTLKKDAEKLLEIRSKTGHLINDAQFIELQKYLRLIEVFAMRPVRAFLPLKPTEDHSIQYQKINNMLSAQNIVVQTGLRFFQAETVSNLMENTHDFRTLDSNSKDKIRNIFLNGVYGIMQADIILYETMQQCKKYGKMNLSDNYYPRYASLPVLAYKAIFPKDERCDKDQDKEIDMIIENYEKDQFYLIEIKHSDKLVINQSKWLTDYNMMNRITNDHKNIVCKAVLYLGKTCFENGINYVNIQEYLNILHDKGIMAALQLIAENNN